MIQVIDGEIKQYSLPKTGTLKDGRTGSINKLQGLNILAKWHSLWNLHLHSYWGFWVYQA